MFRQRYRTSKSRSRRKNRPNCYKTILFRGKSLTTNVLCEVFLSKKKNKKNTHSDTQNTQVVWKLLDIRTRRSSIHEVNRFKRKSQIKLKRLAHSPPNTSKTWRYSGTRKLVLSQYSNVITSRVQTCLDLFNNEVLDLIFLSKTTIISSVDLDWDCK